jgi:hypothetical protein
VCVLRGRFFFGHPDPAIRLGVDTRLVIILAHPGARHGIDAPLVLVGLWTAQAPEDFQSLVNLFVERLRRAHRLRLAQEQVAVGVVQREGEEIEHVLLQVGVEVNEQVAADHQVNAREWHAAAQILMAEDHHLAEGF